MSRQRAAPPSDLGRERDARRSSVRRARAGARAAAGPSVAGAQPSSSTRASRRVEVERLDRASTATPRASRRTDEQREAVRRRACRAARGDERARPRRRVECTASFAPSSGSRAVAARASSGTPRRPSRVPGLEPGQRRDLARPRDAGQQRRAAALRCRRAAIASAARHRAGEEGRRAAARARISSSTMPSSRKPKPCPPYGLGQVRCPADRAPPPSASRARGRSPRALANMRRTPSAARAPRRSAAARRGTPPARR